ncbi:MAG: S8 family serine peptidase [Chloroflexales bacterium]
MTIYQRTAAMVLALIIAAGACAALPASPPTASAQTSVSLTSSPASISADAALGTTQQVAITLQNTGGSDVAPRLYKALAASAPAAALAAMPVGLAAVALPAQAQRVDPQLSAAAAPTDFLVFLADQADLSAAYAISDWDRRGQYVYQTLRDHAARSQADLRAFLDRRGLRYTPLWIVNALAVHGDAADVSALAERADVAMLRADHLTAFDDQVVASATLDQISGCLANTSNVCWNIARVGASRVWEDFGVRGGGITVASIDSGVSYEHPALVGQYRGNLGGGSFNHNYNWYDPYGNAAAPTDAGHHGTHTMGSMVASGGGSASTPAVGVAPSARWIAARACGSSSCSEMTLIEAAQWMLAPTDLSGKNPRPDLRPQVINNSWSSGTANNNWYAGYVAAWRAAGIFAAFAAGNSGNSGGCGSIQSPGDYAQVVGVGALDSSNTIATYSNIGPSSDGRLKPDITAPGTGIVSTSSGFTQDPLNPQYYQTMSGTSMATPHVVGSVALLWSANPSLIGDYDRTYAILTTSASPIGGDARFNDPVKYRLCHATGTPNNIYGYGRIDIYAAVAMATVDVPWLSLPADGLSMIKGATNASLSVTLDARKVPGPGTYQARILVHGTDLSQTPLVIPVTLTVPVDPSYATVSGKVTRASDGTPLAATVSVAEGATVRTDDGGVYQVVLPPSTTSYTLTARALSYAPKAASATLGPGASATRDFALDTNAPRLTANTTLLTSTVALGSPSDLTITLRNDGTQALTYSASLPMAQYGVWRSDQPDGPVATWVDPPADATTVGLTDDGVSDPITIGFDFRFFGQSYTTVVLGANGVLSFSPIAGAVTNYISGCLPAPETPNAALIPLRIDLDPSQAGARVSYAHTAAGFLVSWENVPLFDAPQQRLSFQALLRPDGRATMNYKQIGALPPGALASAGAQQSLTSVQSLGCGSSLSIGSGQTIELRPQPDAAGWASLPSPTGSIPPGQEVTLPVRLTWILYTNPWPASAEIVVASNDPARPEFTTNVRMSTLAAPHSYLYPMILMNQVMP